MKPTFKDRKPPSDTEIRNYFQILKDDPRSRVFAPLAEALTRRGRLTEAEKVCQIGLDANPEFSDGHLAYTRVLFFLFRYQDAMREVKVTLGLDPKNAEAYVIAAEIFLARSQHKAATEACLRAIDLDPQNPDARRILDRLAAEGKAPQPKPAAALPRPVTSEFRATTGTAPSRRLIEPAAQPSLTDPFRQLLEDVGREAEQQLDKAEQPFSHPPKDSPTAAPPDDDADFDIPTKPQKPRKSGTPVPQLPAHPPPPDTPPPVAESLDPFGILPLPLRTPSATPPEQPAVPLVAEASPSTTAAAAASAVRANQNISLIPTVEAVQAVIDSYANRLSTTDLDASDPKMPRSSRKLILVGLILLLGMVGALIAFGMRAEVERQTNRATEVKPQPEPIIPDGPPPLPPPPETTPPAAGATTEATPATGPEAAAGVATEQPAESPDAGPPPASPEGDSTADAPAAAMASTTPADDAKASEQPGPNKKPIPPGKKPPLKKKPGKPPVGKARKGTH